MSPKARRFCLLVFSMLAMGTAARSAPKSSILEKANSAYKARLFDVALDYYDQALDNDEFYASALQGIANCDAALGNKSEAIKYYKLALKNYDHDEQTSLLTYLNSKYPDVDWEAEDSQDSTPLPNSGPAEDVDERRLPEPTPTPGLKNINWSIGPEVGMSSSSLGLVDSQDTWKSLLSALGWSNVAETHDSSKASNESLGLFAKVEISMFSAGLGYRAFNLGNISAIASGNSTGSRYITINETLWFSYQETYLQLGVFERIGQKKNMKLALNLEGGYSAASFTDKLSISGYNGGMISNYATIVGSSNSYQSDITGGFEWDFVRQFGASLNLGYQLVSFTNLTANSVTQDFNSGAKAGDVYKNSDGSIFTLNLNGVAGNLRAFWIF